MKTQEGKKGKGWFKVIGVAKHMRECNTCFKLCFGSQCRACFVQNRFNLSRRYNQLRKQQKKIEA